MPTFNQWFARSNRRHEASQHKLEQARSKKVEEELVECSFRPASNHLSLSSSSLLRPLKSSFTTTTTTSTTYSHIHERGRARVHHRNQKIQQAKSDHEQSLLDECTFYPKISPSTKDILRRKRQREHRPIQLPAKHIKPLVTLQHISAAFRCAWQGVLSHKYGYRRPCAELVENCSDNVVTLLQKVDVAGHQSEDNTVRSQSCKCSSLHQYVSNKHDPIDLSFSFEDDERRTEHMRRQRKLEENLNGLLKRRVHTFKRLKTEYRKRIRMHNMHTGGHT